MPKKQSVGPKKTEERTEEVQENVEVPKTAELDAPLEVERQKSSEQTSVPSSDFSAPLSIDQIAPAAETKVPDVDLNASLVIEEKQSAPPGTVPSLNIDAPLAVEKEISPKSIEVSVQETPTVDINAPLAIETPKEPVEKSQEETRMEQSNKLLFLIGSLLTATIIGSTVAFLLFFSAKPQTQKKALEVSQESPTVTPLPSPISGISKADITFEVLNGSGIAGQAAKIAKKLEDLGFSVIKVGNADKSTYKTTTLLVSKAFEHADLLLQELKTPLNISTVSGTFDDSTASARVIVGKE